MVPWSRLTPTPQKYQFFHKSVQKELLQPCEASTFILLLMALRTGCHRMQEQCGHPKLRVTLGARGKSLFLGGAGKGSCPPPKPQEQSKHQCRAVKPGISRHGGVISLLSPQRNK